MFSGGIEKDQWHEMGLSVPNIECAGKIFHPVFSVVNMELEKRLLR